MQQLVTDLGVCLLGSGADHRMHQTGHCIGTDMGLHAEVPLIVLLGLAHLRIALARPVLGRWGRCDQGRIHDRAGTQQQPALCQQGCNFIEQGLAQIMPLQQAPESQDGRLARQPGITCIQPGEAPQQRNVMQRFFHRRVGISEPLLHQVNPQHRQQRIRLGTVASDRIVRRNPSDQPVPRHRAIHLVEETPACASLCRSAQNHIPPG